VVLPVQFFKITLQFCKVIKETSTETRPLKELNLVNST